MSLRERTREVAVLKAIGYGNSYEAVANATDTGGSGGLGPGTITLVNNTPTY